MDDWDSKYSFNQSSTIHMTEAYTLKASKFDSNPKVYRSIIWRKFQRLLQGYVHIYCESYLTIYTKSNTWYIHNWKRVIYFKVGFKFNHRTDGKIHKYIYKYCGRVNVKKGVTIKQLKIYEPVVVWPTVRIMLILACILGLNIQSMDFYNEFLKADIPKGRDVYIGIITKLKSSKVKAMVLTINKSLYGQREVIYL